MAKSNKMVNRVDEELRQSLDMLSNIFDLNPDAIFLTRLSDGEIINCNKEYLNQIGYSRDEVIGHTSLELNLYSLEERQAYIDEILQRNTVTNFELRVKRKDDVYINVLYSARLVSINGEKILLNIGKDVTERKQAENQIEYHALLLSKVNDAVIGTDSNFHITYWNKGAEHMYGYTETEAVGKVSAELLRPTYAPGERDKIIKELNDKGNSLTIIHTKDRNGTEIIVEVNSTRITDECGNISGYVVVYRNITKQKKNEKQTQHLLEKEQLLTEELQSSNEELQSVTEELQVSNEELQEQRNKLLNVNQALFESEKRMNRSQEIAHLGSWELDIGKNSLSWSDEVYRIFGLGPQEFDATYDAFLDAVHPEDRLTVDEAYSGSIREGRDTYEIEHRIVRKNTGEERIVHEKCEHFRDGSGKIIRSVGMVHDITEQKMAEDALVESEAKFHSLYSSMSEGVAIHEMVYNNHQEAVDYIITDVNQAYEDITGFNKNDVLGKKASDLYSTSNPPYLEKYATVAENGEPIHFENYFEPFNKYFSVSVVTPEKGKIATFFADITERKEVEYELNRYQDELEKLVEARTVELEDAYKSLNESKEHYLTLFNSIDEGFCTIQVIFDNNNNPVDYRFLEINPAFEEQTGLVEAEGKFIRDLAPDNEEYWYEIYGKIALTGKPMRFVNEAKALNKWYDIYAFKIGAPEDREVAILFNDITKYKKTEEALELSSSYNRSLIEASLDPLVTIGPEGKITDVNKSTEIITGYSRDDLIGTDFSDYFTEPEKAQSGYKQVFKHGSVHDYPLEIKNKDGRVTSVLYNAAIYKDKSGEVIGVFASARDITQMKNAENKLKEYQETLEEKVKKRTEELAKSNADLEHFAYVASHDLREPLRMITSFLQLLERRYGSNLDQDANEFIGFAVDGAKRLNDMINDLLEYSKLSKKEKVFGPVGLEKVLEMALINLIIPIEEHDAVINYDPLPTVNGDEKLLVQLFQNLIGNAIKYHGQEPPEIHVSAIKENSKYFISIKDNGIGIESQHLERIFTIFQRLHGIDEYEGTGIGLAIAQKIVDQHGGEIWVESEVGKGTTFHFTIPEQYS